MDENYRSPATQDVRCILLPSALGLPFKGPPTDGFHGSGEVLFAEFVEQQGPGQRRGQQVPLFGRALDRVKFGLP